MSKIIKLCKGLDIRLQGEAAKTIVNAPMAAEYGVSPLDFEGIIPKMLVKVGDTVVIMGRDGEEEISAEKLGSMCHSFNYEIICSFMPRVKRIYK